MSFTPPVKSMHYLLRHAVDVDTILASPEHSDVNHDLIGDIFEGASNFARDVLAPINWNGDQNPARLKGDDVIASPGFKKAYEAWVEGGWQTLSMPEHIGGMGLPQAVNAGAAEMFYAANMAFGLCPMLTSSAIKAIEAHASDELRAIYLENMVSGVWSGAMNLTEPQAGSDLGVLRAKATPNADGTYNISGQKIFITWGDHDCAENIIHLVLARLPDAPAGSKGISLFLCPKFHVNPDGSLGERNNFKAISLEHKLGIHGSPTCVMELDGAKGWLVGEPNRGLACMFTMMNDARFQVGLQGLGAAEASYQGALTYARERVQSRAPQGIQNPDGKADPIVFQPDVARMLLTQKSLIEGCRALSLFYAKFMDVEKLGEGQEKEDAEKILQFLTPICKAFMTDMGLETTSLGVQVFGGHGFIREWGMEQLMRDVRIAMLYEGTNGIQALDLIGRKLTRDGGQMMEATYKAFSALVGDIQDSEAKNLAQGILDDWRASSADCLGMDATTAASAACDYLAYSAYSLIGVLWYSMADKAQHVGNAVLAASKMKTRDFYMERILVRRDAHKAAYKAGPESTLAVSGNEFDYL